MSNVTVQEALKSIELAEETGSVQYLLDALNDCKAALSEIDRCEPVAEAIRERDRLGFAVVNVIGKLDEIIENTQEVEIDDFLHIAVPIDMWNELQAALEDMPKRADLYTSPQPIEKCEPVGWYCKACKETGLSHCSDPENCGGMVRTYTSPQPRDWVEIDRNEVIQMICTMPPDASAKAINDTLKQLNTKG